MFTHHELKLIEHALRFTIVCLDTEAEFLYSDLKPKLYLTVSAKFYHLPVA